MIQIVLIGNFLVLGHSNWIFYPPNIVPQEFTSCYPKHDRQLTHLRGHLRNYRNYTKINLAYEKDYELYFNGDCPLKYGNCVPKSSNKSEGYCVCKNEYYNTNSSTIYTPCKLKRNWKVGFICLAILFGWIGFPAGLMGWSGIEKTININLGLLLLVYIAKSVSIDRTRFTPSASGISDTGIPVKKKCSKICFIRFLLVILLCLLVLSLFCLWIYTLVLLIIKPVNNNGIPNFT